LIQDQFTVLWEHVCLLLHSIVSTRLFRFHNTNLPAQQITLHVSGLPLLKFHIPSKEPLRSTAAPRKLLSSQGKHCCPKHPVSLPFIDSLNAKKEKIELITEATDIVNCVHGSDILAMGTHWHLVPIVSELVLPFRLVHLPKAETRQSLAVIFW
jgi:hypothetical protein